MTWSSWRWRALWATQPEPMSATWVLDPSDPRLDEYRCLNRPRLRDRLEREQNRFIVEGASGIERLIRSDHQVRSFLFSPAKYRRFRSRLDTAGAPIYVADARVIENVSGFNLHRGAVASVTRGVRRSPRDILGSAKRVAALQGVSDAENVGSIFRSAAALGIEALVLDHRSADPYNRRVVRVSMGAVLTMPFSVMDWPELIDGMRESGFETWALTPRRDAQPLDACKPPTKVAIILGSEAAGLDEPTLTMASRRIRIPMTGETDSLNVTHAAAIAFHHVCEPR